MNSIIAQYHAHSDVVAHEFLPIAIDVFGNLIYLAVADSNQGQVYFWQHDSDTDDLFYIAESFTAFIDSLIIYHDEED